MEFKPVIGTRVIMTNGKHGEVTAYPKKDKHQDKVTVTKDNEVGCNSVVMVKYKNLEYEQPDTLGVLGSITKQVNGPVVDSLREDMYSRGTLPAWNGNH